MNVEYFGKQYEITPAIRDEVESGLGKLTKILGDNFKSKVILTVEKHRNIAEITVKRRRGHLVGLAEATDMVVAVNQAIEHIETQVLRIGHIVIVDDAEFDRLVVVDVLQIDPAVVIKWRIGKPKG